MSSTKDSYIITNGQVVNKNDKMYTNYPILPIIKETHAKPILPQRSRSVDYLSLKTPGKRSHSSTMRRSFSPKSRMTKKRSSKSRMTMRRSSKSRMTKKRSSKSRM